MELAGHAVTINDIAVNCFLCYQAILIARLAIKKLRKKGLKNVFREY